MSGRTIVLVNGVPASGKSSLAGAIAEARQWPLLALDTVKEPFFEHVGTGDREFNRALGRASYQAIFALIGAFPPSSICVVDAWFGFQPVETLRAHLKRAGARRALQIWCAASPATVPERYAARLQSRPAGHPGGEYLPELSALAERARPFADLPTFEVATDRPAEISAVLAWIQTTLGEDRL